MFSDPLGAVVFVLSRYCSMRGAELDGRRQVPNPSCGSSSLSEDQMKDMRQKTLSMSSFYYANHSTWLANVVIVIVCEVDCGCGHHHDRDDEKR